MSSMELERVTYQGFCQRIGTIVCRWCVDDFNRLIHDHFTDIIVFDADVFDIAPALNLLGPRDSPEVVLKEFRRLDLRLS